MKIVVIGGAGRKVHGRGLPNIPQGNTTYTYV